MATTFFHRGDRAVVLFSDDLTWQSALDLADVLDTVAEHYYYATIELHIASPGGDTRALRHIVDALDRKRAEGVRLVTRVVWEAASCAAVLACLGDVRVAGPQARLSFHCSRVTNVAQLTAQDSAHIGGVLRRVDAALLRLLVDRALRAPPDPDATMRDGALDADRTVLTRLWPMTAKARRRPSPPRALKKLARALGETVARAVRDRDRDTLSRLYRAVFDCECPVSSPLAHTLHLIDHVGDAEPEPEAQSPCAPPGLRIPEWSALFPPDGDVPRAVLTRHTLALGESGSGKTRSAIIPAIAALARAAPEQAGAALVIDPKCELLPVLSALAPERLHHVRTGGVAINLMAGPRWSIAADLEAGRWLTGATRILCRAASFVPSSPARVLMDHAGGSHNAEFFNREGTSLALTLLAFVLMLLSSPNLTGAAWLPDQADPPPPDPDEDDAPVKVVASQPPDPPDADLHAWLGELRRRAERGPNALALVAWILSGPELSPRASSSTARWPLARLAAAARAALGDSATSEARDLIGHLTGYWSSMLAIGPQIAGVRATAASVCADFATPAIASTLYFGCEPGYAANGIDFSRAVAPDGDAPLVLFQPARDGLDTLVAVALKALFFEAVLNDPQRLRDGADAPLVGYIADEFHRFATSDPVHGEPTYLDACRSFGGFCLLACQSVASIEHALAHGAGNAVADRAALSILWNNTASKLVFRSTDPATAERIAELCPYRPGLAAVTRVRPVSTLAPGECYAVLADGRFERRQLRPFTDIEQPSDD